MSEDLQLQQYTDIPDDTSLRTRRAAAQTETVSGGVDSNINANRKSSSEGIRAWVVKGSGAPKINQKRADNKSKKKEARRGKGGKRNSPVNQSLLADLQSKQGECDALRLNAVVSKETEEARVEERVQEAVAAYDKAQKEKRDDEEKALKKEAENASYQRKAFKHESMPERLPEGFRELAPEPHWWVFYTTCVAWALVAVGLTCYGSYIRYHGYQWPSFFIFQLILAPLPFFVFTYLWCRQRAILNYLYRKSTVMLRLAESQREPEDDRHPDLRADSHAVGKVKHEAKYLYANITRAIELAPIPDKQSIKPCLFGSIMEPIFPRSIFAERYRKLMIRDVAKYYGISKKVIYSEPSRICFKRKHLLVSAELLAQMTGAGTFVMSKDPKDIHKQFEYLAQINKTVNVDRYIGLETPIHANTVEVATAYWLIQRSHRFPLGFQ